MVDTSSLAKKYHTTETGLSSAIAESDNYRDWYYEQSSKVVPLARKDFDLNMDNFMLGVHLADMEQKNIGPARPAEHNQ